MGVSINRRLRDEPRYVIVLIMVTSKKGPSFLKPSYFFLDSHALVQHSWYQTLTLPVQTHPNIPLKEGAYYRTSVRLWASASNWVNGKNKMYNRYYELDLLILLCLTIIYSITWFFIVGPACPFLRTLTMNHQTNPVC